MLPLFSILHDNEELFRSDMAPKTLLLLALSRYLFTCGIAIVAMIAIIASTRITSSDFFLSYIDK